jgi:hypothetical protein
MTIKIVGVKATARNEAAGKVFSGLAERYT